MIVVDSSALIAILEYEPERPDFIRSIQAADRRLLSAVNYQETGQVAFGRRGAQGLRALDDMLALIKTEIVPHDAELSRLALAAFQRYGKGIHSKSRLNLGDCAAYALSKKTGAPLLFKGNDFAATDITPAV